MSRFNFRVLKTAGLLLFTTTGLLLFTTTALAINTVSSAAFVASDNSVSFALNIPQADTSNDLYFTLSGPSSSAWVAVGMGNNQMDDTLMFILYSDSTGNNITLSPRRGHGNTEPTYTKDIEVNVLAESGIFNGMMKANAMCKNCRSWGERSISPNDTAAKFIYSSGSGSLESNSLSAGLRRHSSYGSFTMDLTKAYGKAGVPITTSDTSGTVQTSSKSDHDVVPALHACAMILAFVGLLPLGVIVLRILNRPKWHGFNQALSALVALIGVCLGFYVGTLYNRTKGFSSAHQIFGIIIIAGMIAQLFLGGLHHRIYKKTSSPSKFGNIHVWLGRVVIPCGIANGFLGFPLAMNTRYNWALLALVLFMAVIILPFAFWRYKRNASKKSDAFMAGDGGGYENTGYQSQPWTTAPSRSDINLNQMNYPSSYQPPAETRQFI